MSDLPRWLLLWIVITLTLLFQGQAAGKMADKTSSKYWLERMRTTQSYYKAEEWGAFFAETLFFRMHLPNLEEALDKDLVDTYLALEIVGLSKHCQWKILKEFSAAYLQSDSQKMSYPKAAKAFSFVKLKQDLKLPDINQAPVEIGFVERLKERRDQWPVKFQQLAQLQSPKGVSLNLESQCENSKK